MNATTKPILLSSIFKVAFQQWGPTLKATFFWILLLVLIKNITHYPQWSTQHWVWQSVALLSTVLLVVWGLAGLFTAAGKVLMSPTFTKSTLLWAVHCFWRVAAALLLYFLVGTFFYYIAFYVGLWWPGSQVEALWVRALIIILLAGLPILYGVVRFIFVLPLIILQDKPLFRAFVESYRLVGGHWWLGFCVYFLLEVVLVLTSSQTAHYQFMLRHHLNVVYDAVVLLLTLPILLNFWLTLFERIAKTPVHEHTSS